MKIFEFNYDFGTVKEWIISPSEEEATLFYLGLTGNDELENTVVTEIPKEKWSEYKTIDPNEYDEDKEDEDGFENGYKIIGTFDELAERHKTGSDILCTTEY